MSNPYVARGTFNQVVSTVKNQKQGDTSTEYPVQHSYTPLDGRSSLRYLVRETKRYTLQLIVGFICACTCAIAHLVTPYFIGRICDSLTLEGGHLTFAIIGLGITVVIAAMSSWISSVVLGNISINVCQRFRTRATKGISQITYSHFARSSTQDAHARVINDIDTLMDALSVGLPQLALSSITLIGGVICMWILAYPLAICMLVSLPLLVYVNNMVIRGAQKHFSTTQQMSSVLSDYIEESIATTTLIQACGRTKQKMQEFSQLNQSLASTGVFAQFISSLSNPTTRLLNNLLYAGLLGCASFLIITSTQTSITVGVLVSLLAYAQHMMKPAFELTATITQLQSGYTALTRICALLHFVEDTSKHERKKSVIEYPQTHSTPLLELSGVSFGYIPQKLVLKDINCTLKAGQRLAICGETGSGKTTLLSLITRLYDTRAGVIRMYGRDIQSYTPDELRSHMALVLQESKLISGSIFENICYGNKTCTREEIERICADIGIDKFTNQLKDTIDTVIDPQNPQLSAGQIQLICIARALAANPELLLLDEATSTVDTRTEALVTRALDTLMQDRASIIVAHRLSTIMSADEILVLKHGRISERGNHTELMAQKGIYYQLVASDTMRT